MRVGTYALGAVSLAAIGAHVLAALLMDVATPMGLSMLVLAAACLPCASAVLKRGDSRSVQMLALTAALIAFIHVLLTLGHVGIAAHAHIPVESSAAVPTSVWPGVMLGIAALDYSIAVAAALVWARARRAAGDGVQTDECPAPIGAGHSSNCTLGVLNGP